jgi:Kef-type K+ transport system membrane component KefB
MGSENGHGDILAQAVILLGALALAGPGARVLRTSPVLGYLLVGILIGPHALGRLWGGVEAGSIRGLAEFGVILLLFVIGLELRPKRVWAMRSAVFGTGALQVGLTAAVLMAVAVAFGLAPGPALYVGLALSLSSTALALQVLEEKGEIVTQHGRTAFAILLMQDLVSIPVIAMAPLFALGVTAAGGAPHAAPGWTFALIGFGTIGLIIAGGRLVLAPLYRLAALSGVNEATTAAALLTVAGVALVMGAAGLSPALGAFIAGALLADSEFRHDIKANIEPFEGLLLGLFFTVIGMSLNLRIIVEQPALIVLLAAGLIAAKTAILYVVGRWHGHEARPARRLALATAQGGEFAFVLFSAGVGAAVLDARTADILSVVVTLSMMATPLLMSIDDRFKAAPGPERAFDTPPEEQGHVIIAGFGRFGQVVGRVLAGKGIPFIALENSMEQIDFVRRFGSEVYYGDASRLDLLLAARADRARAFVLAIDNVETSLRTAEMVRRHYPKLPILARARNRQHVHKLLDLGVTHIRREMFLSTLDLTRLLLIELGNSPADAQRLIETFKDHDRKRLYSDYAHYTDLEKLASHSLAAQRELEDLFATDRRESDKAAGRAKT